MKKIQWLRGLKSLFAEQSVIIWMMLVAITPMILVIYFSFNEAQLTLQTTINTSIETEIKKKVQMIDSYISDKKLHLIQFSELPTLVNIIKETQQQDKLDMLDPSRMTNFTEYLRYILPRIGVRNAYIVNPEGKVIFELYPDITLGQVLQRDIAAHMGLYRAFDGARVLQLPYVYTSFQRSEHFLSRIYLSNVIRVNDMTRAVLVLSLDSDAIEKVVRQIGFTQYEQTMLAMLVDDKPITVFGTRFQGQEILSPRVLDKMDQLFKRAIMGEMGPPIEVNEGGDASLAIYSYVPQLNMGMIVQYSKKHVYEQIHHLKINLIVITGISISLVIMIVSWIANALREAQMRSARLLQNILPQTAIDELKEKKHVVARHVKGVSIIFIDIVSFTAFSATKPPEVIIVILDQIFSILDDLCEKYQLEKIKTIGDAYMAVAGLLVADPDHAQRAVDMGLDAIAAMQEYNEKNQTPLGIRVGVNSGDVVAGVIGRKKFSYDLWGSAVNYASRMESTGIVSEVQISMNTYAMLNNKDKYLFTPHHVTAKGIGDVDTYVVKKKPILGQGQNDE